MIELLETTIWVLIIWKTERTRTNDKSCLNKNQLLVAKVGETRALEQGNKEQQLIMFVIYKLRKQNLQLFQYFLKTSVFMIIVNSLNL